MYLDPVSDLLTRIRNAQQTRHAAVRVKCSNLAERILQVLKEEGFISSFQKKPAAEGGFEELEIQLKYFSNGDPVMHRLERVSSPGQRRYSRCSKLPVVNSGLGVAIISTSRGVLSDRQARELGVGGEVLAIIG